MSNELLTNFVARHDSTRLLRLAAMIVTHPAFTVEELATFAGLTVNQTLAAVEPLRHVGPLLAALEQHDLYEEASDWETGDEERCISLPIDRVDTESSAFAGVCASLKVSHAADQGRFRILQNEIFQLRLRSPGMPPASQTTDPSDHTVESHPGIPPLTRPGTPADSSLPHPATADPSVPHEHPDETSASPAPASVEAQSASPPRGESPYAATCQGVDVSSREFYHELNQ